ncbi:MAG: hypothetical protein ABWZ16_07145 [Microbacterium sp.]
MKPDSPDVSRFPVAQLDRRTVLKGSAWAAPVLVAAFAAPAARASDDPPPSARADWYESNPALTIETSASGTPLPAGIYTFSTTGGVPLSTAVFQLTAEQGGVVTAVNATTIGVVLSAGHSVQTFTAYLVRSLIDGAANQSATFSVVTPGGTMATASIFATPPVAYPAGIFGPDGSHWPSRTPRFDDEFAHVYEVDASWSAINAAIKDAVAKYPNDKVKVAVRPGTFPIGSGAGSTKKGVLQNIGGSARPWRILIAPRDGWGTVVGSGTLADQSTQGYGFVGVRGLAIMGFDFAGQAVVLRNSQDVAIGWSTFGHLDVTANGATVTDIELVECVLPDQITTGKDRMSWALNSYSIDGLRMSGCYVAPGYKRVGNSAHLDTLQAFQNESTDQTVRNVVIEDSILFQSSNQAIQFQYVNGVTLDHTAVIGGLRGTGRYPIGAGLYVPTAQNTLHGGDARNARLIDSVIYGSISSTWQIAGTSGTIVAPASKNTPASGSFTVDPTWTAQNVPLDEAWYANYCPLPDRARLKAIWG